ncbi:hypothetical protein Hanom_Chr05g00404791 [Helianthus anomalus]
MVCTSSDTPCELRPISTNARQRMVCTSSDTPCELRPISTNARRRMMCTSSDTPCASNKIRRIITNTRWGVACTGSIIPRTSEIQQFCRCRGSASHASILTYKQTLLFLTPYRTL